ncbi:tyrosine-protein phosphatase [Parabacteroides sp.]
MKKSLFSYLLLLFCASGLFVSCSDDDDNGGKNTIGYSGKDLSGEVELTRPVDTKKAVLKVSANEAWTLYAGSTAEDIDLNTPCASGNGKEDALELDTEAGKRYIFMFKTAEGQAMLAEKILPVNGYNFRDLGGIKNKDGKYVRWGRLFRTDEMYKLTPEDLSYLASTGLKTIVDFRTDTEKEGGFGGMMPASYDKRPSTVQDSIDLKINAGNIFSDEILNSIRNGATAEELKPVMVNSYIEMVTVDDYVAKYKEFFKLLQDESYLPLSFHCSAGKDRTGVAAMLILSALDVDKATIMKDYMLSAELVKDKYKAYVGMIPAIAPLVTVKEEYLNAAYDEIDKKYGSMTKFLTETLGVDIQKMKELYLY